MDTGARKVLLVDDNEAILEMLASFLQQNGYIVQRARDVAEARAQLIERPESWYAVITDNEMPKTLGVEFIHEILAKGMKPLLILMTGMYDEDSARTWVERKQFKLLEKPFQPSEILKALNPGVQAA